MLRLFLLLSVGIAVSTSAQSVTSFTLVNADTDTDIATLSDADTIVLSQQPTTNLSIRANTSGTVGSVQFDFAGSTNYRTEGVAPYALGGDTNGNYAPVPELKIAGTYTLTATASSNKRTRVSRRQPASLSITFTVVTDPGGGGPPSGGPDGDGTVTVTGVDNAGAVSTALYQYRPVTLSLAGPYGDELLTPNPFLEYRFDVRFTSPSNDVLTVPGYFAADGDAANTSATSGTVWRAHLTPSEPGTWRYDISFFAGPNASISDPMMALGEYDGRYGTFSVGAVPANSPGNYAKGPLRYVGGKYLQFDNGEWFIKGGADSPENLLAFADFDNTSDSNSNNPVKSYATHVADWNAGDPTWGSGLGKGLIGALNYLESEGMNAFSFLPFNAPQGDGKDVWPWLTPTQTLRYDVSKLAQWEVVFSHADRLGLFLHFKTQETENDQYLDGGALQTERRLYYRELIARFGHHMALNWNLGEENTNTTQQLKDFAEYIDALDVYDHPIVVHTYPGQLNSVYGPLMGDPHMTGASIQLGNMSGGHDRTLDWIENSENASRPWHVAIDEPGNANVGVSCDGSGNNHFAARSEALWANLMAGGTGVEWYFGYGTCAGDLNAQDWRTRDQLWDYTRYALEFFRTHLSFWTMTNADDLTSDSGTYVFADAPDVYALYADDASGMALDLPAGTYTVRWFDPRNGGALQIGSTSSVSGGTDVSLGTPPNSASDDWAVLVTNAASKRERGDIGRGGAGTPGSPVEFAVYPNPAFESATFAYHLDTPATIRLDLYDALGRRLQTLANAHQTAGMHHVTLNRDNLPAGVYLWHLQRDGHVQTGKVVFK